MHAIRLPPSIEDRLARFAQESGNSKTTLTHEAIVEYIDDLENYDLAEARAGKNRKTISLEDLEKSLRGNRRDVYR